MRIRFSGSQRDCLGILLSKSFCRQQVWAFPGFRARIHHKVASDALEVTVGSRSSTPSFACLVYSLQIITSR